MKWPWQRDPTSDKDVGVLMAEAASAMPLPDIASTGAAAPAGDFRLVVEDVFSITGRGTVVTGKVSAGSVRIGQEVRIVRGGAVLATTTVTGIEAFRKVIDVASSGETVGLLLARVPRSDVQRDDVIEV